MLDFSELKQLLTDQGYHLDMIQPNEDKSITLTISPTGEVSQGALERWNAKQEQCAE